MVIRKTFFLFSLIILNTATGNNSALAGLQFIQPNKSQEQSKKATLQAQDLSAEEKLALFVAQNQMQLPVLISLLEDAQMVAKNRQKKLQKTMNLFLVTQQIQEEGVATFQARLEPQVALIYIYQMLAIYFNKNNDSRVVQALATSADKMFETMQQKDPAFQTKASLYLQLFSEDPRFIERQKVELQRVSVELANKMKVTCPSFEQLTKKAANSVND